MARGKKMEQDPGSSPAAASIKTASTDDFDALFDEIASNRPALKEGTSDDGVHLPLLLAGELNIVEVARFKPLLQQAFDASKSNDVPLRIDLAAVTECDGAGMQMMLALSRSASAARLSLELLQVPLHMNGLFERFGLTPHFTTFTKKEAK